MTEHVEPTPEHLAYWVREDQLVEPFVVVIGGPEEGDDVIPCPTAISAYPDELGNRALEYHVPLKLDEIELAAMAQGGTLWLTTFGVLPVHRLEVQPPPGFAFTDHGLVRT